MMTDDYDLYGDVIQDHTVGSLDTGEVEKLRSENARLKRELDEARKQAAQLQDVNRILKKNISCLFKTAQQEIQRKDAVITVFQAQQDRAEKAALLMQQQMLRRGDS